MILTSSDKTNILVNHPALLKVIYCLILGWLW